MAYNLFLKENLSFLAIQEPFSSQHKVSESWRTFRLNELEKRIKQLYASLWNSDIRQHVDGKLNKLVHISENQALNISFILNKFDAGVKDIMHKLELTVDSHPNDKAGKHRGNIRKNQGLKLFQNLPIQTNSVFQK